MKSILITPKNASELKLIKELMEKMKISSSVLSVEETEDLGLAILMKEVDRTKKVSKDIILKKLNS